MSLMIDERELDQLPVTIDPELSSARDIVSATFAG